MLSIENSAGNSAKFIMALLFCRTRTEYINKDTCIECGYNLLKCYGYCMKHINKLDIVTLHKELLTIFEKLTNVEKINLKLSIAEIMFKIKRDKIILKRKISEYKDKYLKQPKTAEIIANNKEFINKNNILYKKLIEKYTLTDKEKRKDRKSTCLNSSH